VLYRELHIGFNVDEMPALEYFMLMEEWKKYRDKTSNNPGTVTDLAKLMGN
jgi:hypothetical protein